MRAYENLTYSEQNGTKLDYDLYLPDADEFDVLVYFHGGGIEHGSHAGGRAFAPYLAERGIATATFDYRKYPDHAYPDFLVDAANAVKFTKNLDGKYGKIKRIFVSGSSAGGYISMMLAFDKRWLAGAGVEDGTVDGYIHDAGQPTAHFNVLKYKGVDSRRVIVDDTAPLYHIGADENYPPMRFIVSDNDMYNRYEQTMLVMSTLRHFGHTEPKMTLTVMNGKHCAYVKRFDENGESDFGKIICDFVSSLS